MTLNKDGASVMMEVSEKAEAFRWSRVATMAVVFLIHAGFVFLLLLPTGAWRWRGEKRSPARPDALSLRFIAMPPPLPTLPRTRARPPAHAPSLTHRPRVEAPVVVRSLQPPPPSVSDTSNSPPPVADASNAVPTYVPGGGRLAAGSDYTRDNVHLPGSAKAVRGAPALHMADPRMQGIAGAVRTVQRLFGIPDSHCVDVDTWRGMTMSERIAKHIDDSLIDETAARYHCGP